MHKLKIKIGNNYYIRILKNREMNDGLFFRPIMFSTSVGKSHFVNLHYKAVPKRLTSLELPTDIDYDALLPESIVASLR